MKMLVVAVVLAAYAVTWAGLLQTPTYEASARVLVGQDVERLQPLQPRIPLVELQNVIAMKTRAIHSRPVAEEAIQRLGAPTNLGPQTKPDMVLANLTVQQEEGTQFVRLTYEDSDPMRARLIANTVGEVSSELISERSSNLTATVWEKATLPESPVSPHPLRNGLLTLVIGLMLCAVFALPRSRPPSARVSGKLVRRSVRQAGSLSVPSIVERVREKELLRALGRHGKLTAMEASLATSLSVEESQRILEELAFAGQLQVIVEHGRLYYAFWERD
jgi:capsular polysaccharide biosynthesis protein